MISIAMGLNIWVYWLKSDNPLKNAGFSDSCQLILRPNEWSEPKPWYFSVKINWDRSLPLMKYTDSHHCYLSSIYLSIYLGRRYWVSCRVRSKSGGGIIPAIYHLSSYYLSISLHIYLSREEVLGKLQSEEQERRWYYSSYISPIFLLSIYLSSYLSI